MYTFIHIIYITPPSFSKNSSTSQDVIPNSQLEFNSLKPSATTLSSSASQLYLLLPMLYFPRLPITTVPASSPTYRTPTFSQPRRPAYESASKCGDVT